MPVITHHPVIIPLALVSGRFLSIDNKLTIFFFQFISLISYYQPSVNVNVGCTERNKLITNKLITSSNKSIYGNLIDCDKNIMIRSRRKCALDIAEIYVNNSLSVMADICSGI